LDIDEERNHILSEEQLFFLFSWFIRMLYYVMMGWDSSD